MLRAIPQGEASITCRKKRFPIKSKALDPTITIIASHRFTSSGSMDCLQAGAEGTGVSVVPFKKIKLYLSLDSTLVRAYGFIYVDFDIESSSMKHTRGSFYLFIPEIELDELEGISNLAATLVWDDSSLCTFEEAVQSFELALYQLPYFYDIDLGNDTMEVIHCSYGSMLEGEADDLKRVFLEGNPYLLVITMIVSVFHSIFNFLAFKNDIQFWNKNKSTEGLSAKSVIDSFITI
ncbi:hypothetical protein ACSBR2_010699 [Camellia fascicularis]